MACRRLAAASWLGIETVGAASSSGAEVAQGHQACSPPCHLPPCRPAAARCCPSSPAGFIPFEFASYTRWSWALQPAWYSAGPIKKGAHTLFRPIKAAAWGLFGLIFPIQTGTPCESSAAAAGQPGQQLADGPASPAACPLPSGKCPSRGSAAPPTPAPAPLPAAAIKPKQGLLEGVYDTVGMVDSRQLSKAFKSGRLAAKAGRVSAVTPTGVDLEDGTSLEVRTPVARGAGCMCAHGGGASVYVLCAAVQWHASSAARAQLPHGRHGGAVSPQVDIVVLATGYRATARSLLPQELQAAAGYKGDSQWLYR